MQKIIIYLLMGALSAYSFSMETKAVKDSAMVIDSSRSIVLISALKTLAVVNKVQLNVSKRFPEYIVCHDGQSYTFFRDYHNPKSPVTVLVNNASHQFDSQEIQKEISNLSLKDNLFILLLSSVFEDYLPSE